jgi:hypothetical protein
MNEKGRHAASFFSLLTKCAGSEAPGWRILEQKQGECEDPRSAM